MEVPQGTGAGDRAPQIADPQNLKSKGPRKAADYIAMI